GAYGNDPYGNFNGLDPNGGNYSSRVGGQSINRAYGYGAYGPSCDGGFLRPWGYHWDNIWSNGEYIENTYTVNSTNALLSYNYAAVLNDGAHPNGQQPYFHIEIVDASGNPLSVCTQYYVQAPAGAPPTGFTLSGTANNGPVYYKSWTANSVNLTPYIGQAVTARFTAAGCTQGGHFGYAYIDASCSAVNITISPASPCAGGTAILTAPAVAGGTYAWTGPGIVGPSTNQSVTVNVSGTYSVTVTPAQGAGCAYTLSTTVTFASPSGSISASGNVNCFGGNNGSATVSASGGNPAYTYAWSPSGGNAATANNLTAGNYTVVITDVNGCTGTASVAITQPAALTTTPSQTNLNCNGVCIGSATVTPG
ncbi:MAG: hypothetical protein FD130_2222, partial [Halothiobacillaceae bacterium]